MIIEESRGNKNKNMKKTELANLKKLVTKVGNYTPKEAPKKPSKAPTSKQLKRSVFFK